MHKNRKYAIYYAFIKDEIIWRAPADMRMVCEKQDRMEGECKE